MKHARRVLSRLMGVKHVHKASSMLIRHGQTSCSYTLPEMVTAEDFDLNEIYLIINRRSSFKLSVQIFNFSSLF